MRALLTGMLLLGPGAVPGAAAIEAEVFTPYRIGLELGQAAGEVTQAMRRQGFEFATEDDAAGFDFETAERVAVIEVQGFDLADAVIRVTERMGSAVRWESNDVVLGLRDGALAFVHEAAVLPVGEARLAFSELEQAFQALFGGRAAAAIDQLLLDDFPLLTLGRSQSGIRDVPVAPRRRDQADMLTWTRGPVATSLYLLPAFANPGALYLGVTSFHRCAYPAMVAGDGAGCGEAATRSP